MKSLRNELNYNLFHECGDGGKHVLRENSASTYFRLGLTPSSSCRRCGTHSFKLDANSTKTN